MKAPQHELDRQLAEGLRALLFPADRCNTCIERPTVKRPLLEQWGGDWPTDDPRAR